MPSDAGTSSEDAGTDAGCSAFVACRAETAFSGGRITTLADDVARVVASPDRAGGELVAVSSASGSTQLWRSADGGFEQLGAPLALVALSAVAVTSDAPLVLDDGDSIHAPRLFRWSCADGWTAHSELPLAAGTASRLFAQGDELLLGGTSPSHAVQVFRWTSAGWQELGGSALERLSTMALGLDGQPLAAGRVAGGRVDVQRWDGAAWTSLGALPVARAFSPEPQVLVDSQGDVVVAWADRTEVQVARFDGVSWSTSAVTSPGDGPLVVRLALGPDGAPWVAWSAYFVMHDFRVQVARWNGTGWSTVLSGLRAGSSGEAIVASLRVENDTPVVWWHEADLPSGVRRAAERWSSRGCGP